MALCKLYCLRIHYVEEKTEVWGCERPRAEAGTWGSGLVVQSSLCTHTTVDTVRRKVRPEGSVHRPPVCHISAAGRPGVAQGCIGLNLSQVSDHVAGGARRRSPIRGAQAGVRGLPRPSCGLWSLLPPCMSPPAGLGMGLELIWPLPHPWARPQLSAAWFRRCPCCSPQWSPQPVLNLSDSCPQPSQLRLISEGFPGPG